MLIQSPKSVVPTLIEGLIVLEMKQDLKYLPLLAAGFAFAIASISVLKFSINFSTPNETLPIKQ